MLGKVIGDCLRDLSGLNAAYLPAGVPLHIAQEIVEYANTTGVDSQFAILVVPSGSSEGMSTSEALKYRQGNRLAVVAGRHPDLGSFTQSFREVLGLNYPETAGDHVVLSSIAQSAVRLLLMQAEIAGVPVEAPTEAIDILESVLKRASDVQAELREGADSWNVQWFLQTETGLRRLAELTAAKAVSSSDISDFLAKHAYAAFGMSRPQAGHKPTEYSAKSLAEAFKVHWSDNESVVSSIGYLSHVPNEPEPIPHALEKVDWSGFDQKLAVTDNRPLTFAQYYDFDDSISTYLAELTDQQFVNPASTASGIKHLQVFTADGTSAAIAETNQSKGPYLAVSEILEWEGRSTSEELIIKIPTLASVSADDLSATNIMVYTSAPKTTWEGKLELSESGELQSRGRLSKELGKTPWKVHPKSVVLKLDLSPNDHLATRIEMPGSCDVHMIYPEIGGLLAAPLKGSVAKPSVGKPIFRGTTEYSRVGEVDENPLDSLELDASIKKHRFIVWSDSLEKPRIDGDPMSDLQRRPSLYYIDRESAPLLQFDFGCWTVECRSLESMAAPRSPVVAAITKSPHSKDPLDLEIERSLRGAYEAWVATHIGSELLYQSHGHVVMPSDRELDSFPVVVDKQSGFAMSEELTSHWGLVSDQEIPEELSSSESAKAFREAFDALDLRSKFFGLNEDSEIPASRPSTTSWRGLWDDRAVLERYLDAYSDLIEEAKRIGDPAGRFWATYPFSISIWSTENTARCESVLLSPLHPIRLSWLAGVEHTLWNSQLAGSLAGTVEGWNFPIVGPRETEMGRLMAVPVETGTDQVFLGWSMLVQASVEQYDVLASPEKAGSLRVPGTAVSGLNATAVSAAMRSYRRMNPQVTTLTVDLSASAKTTRMGEVDDALLEEISAWSSKEQVRLFGGARVWDSINRGGEPPAEKIGRLVRTTRDVPLTWSRYSPKDLVSMPCNVRILQDGGVNVMLKSAGQAPRLGLVGRVPLRRFEAVSGQTIKNNTAISSPTLHGQLGWLPFTRAVSSVEGSASTTQIATKLFAAHLTSESADWTVSGESLMNPSAMASIVQKSGKKSQMLWEWRPPFLESGTSVPALERRPFVSIARVPKGFRKQLERLLEKATGKTSDDNLVDSLLGRLGTRGVGLSSMLAMGGTHAAGALGFYLVFSMMDSLAQPDDHTYVLPIDACDNFMRALAPNQGSIDSKRRADVLILRVEDDAIRLVPVEIKFYGLDVAGPSGNLPENRTDGLLNEPLEQVQKSLEVLNNLQAAWADIQVNENGSDRYLWANGMAALVESAIRLAPSPASEPVELGRALENLVEGSSNVIVGRPLIAYFKHKASARDGSRCVSRAFETDGDLGQFGLLAANSETAFEALERPDSEMTLAWGELVEWALSSSGQSPLELDSANETQTERSADQYASHTSEIGDSRQEFTGSAVNEAEEASSIAKTVPSGEEITSKADEDVSTSTDGSSKTADADEPGDVQSKIGSAKSSAATKAIEEPAGAEASKPSRDHGVSGSVGVKFPVGTILTDDSQAEFWPSNTRLNQLNLGIVGDLGTGKTQLLKALIYQLREESRRTQTKPLSMLVFDYKRDFQDEEFLEAVGGKVLRINRIPLNFFALRDGYSPMGATQRANEFIDVLDKIYGGIGPVQKDRLQVTITDLYKEETTVAPTIGRILKRYNDDVSKPDAVTSLLRKFVTAEVFTEEPEDFVNFDELMDSKVVVVALNDFGTDDDGKNALVVLFLNLYYDYMMHAKKWPFVGEEPQLRVLNSFLLVDEAINIMKYKFPVLMSLLLQGREFGFGVMLSSQYLNHFRQGGEDYAQPLLTWFIHKVPSVTSKDLSALGLSDRTDFLAGRITSLPLHHSLYKSLDVSGKFIKEVPFYSLINPRVQVDE